MTYLDIDLESFCTWLCEHSDEVVGHPGQWFGSPLALWLSERAGQRYGVDGSCYGRASCEEAQWPLPRWAQVFVAYLEQTVAYPVTGYQAFVVLARVELALAALDVLGRSSTSSSSAR